MYQRKCEETETNLGCIQGSDFIAQSSSKHAGLMNVGCHFLRVLSEDLHPSSQSRFVSACARMNRSDERKRADTHTYYSRG
jgi:hypothetical protein